MAGLPLGDELHLLWNKNEIVELVHNYKHPETGEYITKDRLEIKGLGKAKYILKPGGTLGDLYTNSDLVYNQDGYIEVDKSGNVAVKDDYMEDIYLGSVFPKYNLAWRNDFSWKGLNLGLLFTARIGGICYSATQANMDLYGVSEASAAARDAGGVIINGRQTIDAQKWYQAIGAQSGLPQYYTYSATNFRLQELSLGYTLPREVVPRQDADDRLVRRAQSLDDLLQGTVRPRGRGLDGAELPGHRLLYDAVAAQPGL